MTESNPNRDSPSPSPSPKLSDEINKADRKFEFSGQKVRYRNPPEIVNPDPATLRDQWRFAIKQYSKWYSHAWGTAILAGISFFTLGWIIKGSNPLPSRQDHPSSSPASPDSHQPRT